MPIRFIGNSIQEAIDWTQDALHTTRPIAENVLFSLLNENKARETEDGFVLLREADDEELMRRKNSVKHRPRFRFHAKRQQRDHINTLQKGDTSVDFGDAQNDGMDT